MANDLFDLFRDKLKTKDGLVATEPQSLESLSNAEEDQDLILEKLAELEQVELKIDYSDFSNFVFFNSALDYFNITGEKILNDYPYDGSVDTLKKFERDLDGYQKYALSQWPSHAGHLRFDTAISSSWVSVDDVGLDVDGGTYRVGILSPSTGSFSLEMWYNPAAALTGPDDVQILVQNLSSSIAPLRKFGYTLYLTGSEVRFSIQSGSITNEVASPFTPGEDQYVAVAFDRSSFTGSLLIMTGSSEEFPVKVASSSIDIFGSMNIGGTPFTMASGSIGGKTTVFYTGSMDDVRVWKKVRTLDDVSGSFNVKQYAQKNLVGLFRFNSSGSAFVESDNATVIDYSGRKLNGTINEYYPGIRGSGSLLLSEKLDPILNFNTSDVSSYITDTQAAALAHDRSHKNKITDMFPENFFTFPEEIESDILKNFLYIYARNLDNIKMHIDQFTNILKVNYGKFDQTPDALLDMVAKFFGWEFTGNFLSADAFQYILGKNVLGNVEANVEMDQKLFEIKNEFWRRVLINLPHIYKTKGTRESIKSMFRAYGVNENFVRIKEFGTTPNVGIETKRIKAEKSVSALGFASGTLTGSLAASFTTSLTGGFTVEGRFRFPLTSSNDIIATQLSGTLLAVATGPFNSAASEVMSLIFEKDAISSHTGTLTLSSSDETNVVQLTDVGLFDGRWHNIAIINDHQSASLSIQTRTLNEDEVESFNTASLSGISSGMAFTGPWESLGVGPVFTAPVIGANIPEAAEFWSQEIRYWDDALTDSELDDHTLNFQSYGVCDTNIGLDNLKIHWRLREDVTASLAGAINPEDSSVDSNVVITSLTSSGFNPSENPYKKFLLDFNYIASLDFGWNEDKIRIFDTAELKDEDFVDDAKTVSLEFNMVDALNEDIVQIMKSLDQMNELLGFPANKYRVHYDDLEIVRFNYFKRLQGRLNFTVFSNLLEFFDRSFIDMVKKLLPARAFFMGDEFVVESHILERPKITYERRKKQEVEFAPEGRIEMWTRFGINDDDSGRKFPVYLTGSVG